jgi:hypothetical protein
MTAMRAAIGRGKEMAEPTLIAVRWLRSPARARADLRSAAELLRRAHAGEQAPAAELLAAAERSVELGRHSLARELLDVASSTGDGARAVLLARRRVPGYVGDVSAELVDRAAALASTARGGPRERIRPARATPLTRGVGGGVEAVVRHRLSDGTSMIRKTLLGVAPREVLAYRSGLLAGGGRWWRAPRVYLAEEEEDGRWHLFLEDLGPIRRPSSAAALSVAARALGEMNGAHVGDETLARRHEWLAAATRRALPFVRPRRAMQRLTGVIDDDLTRRVGRTSRVLVENEAVLTRVHSDLPTTFCHGDANPSNVVVDHALRDHCVALFDWSVCGLDAVATDLGSLLAVPGAPIDPAVVERCLRAYSEGLATSAASPVPSAEALEYGYRHRFVTYSLRRQLALLPSTPRPAGRVGRLRDSATLAWSGRRRSRIGANLTRWCDEADALLALVVPGR